MRDLKTTGTKTARVRSNKLKRVKREKPVKREKREKPVKRERLEINWRKFLRRGLYLGVAVTSCTLTVVGLFFLVQLTLASDLFHIDQVMVSGCEQLQKRQVIDLSDIKRGVNTFDLDLDLIGQQIEANPWVATVGVKRIFPSHIAIDLQERKPLAIINLGLLYYLDVNGEVFKVLDSADDLDYPMITGFDYQRIEADDSEYDVALKQIVALIADLQQRSVMGLQQISEIHLEETGGLALYTKDDAVRVCLGRDDFATKLDRLEKIYARLRPQLKVLDYIDLSVDEKVIVRIERPTKSVRS